MEKLFDSSSIKWKGHVIEDTNALKHIKGGSDVSTQGCTGTKNGTYIAGSGFDTSESDCSGETIPKVKL